MAASSYSYSTYNTNNEDDDEKKNQFPIYHLSSNGKVLMFHCDVSKYIETPVNTNNNATYMSTSASTSASIQMNKQVKAGNFIVQVNAQKAYKVEMYGEDINTNKDSVNKGKCKRQSLSVVLDKGIYTLTKQQMQSSNIKLLHTVDTRKTTKGGSTFKLILRIYTDDVNYQECAISRVNATGLWRPFFIVGGNKSLFFINIYPCNPKKGYVDTKIVINDFITNN